jgi:hypothetical protein
MDKVYYVSYGSNLLTERFNTYIKGGYISGNNKNHIGCRDKAPPQNKIPLKIRGKIIMSGSSKHWGGGYAFFNPRSNKDLVLAAGYLITFQQFEDVTAQENNLHPGQLKFNLQEIVKKGFLLLNHGAYNKIIFLGYYDGIPMLTFTSNIVDELPQTIASKSYMKVIGKGIRETFTNSIRESEVFEYLNKINSSSR